MRWIVIVSIVCMVVTVGMLRFFRPGQARGRVRAAAGFRPGANRRLWSCVSVAVLMHLALIVPSLVQLGGCQHDRPLGVFGGSGDKIAKGTPEGVAGGSGTPGQPQQAVVKARMVSAAAGGRRPDRGRSQFMARMSPDGLRQFIKSYEGAEVRIGTDAEMESALDSVGGQGGEGGALGLEQGQGTGPTAAGSPWGTRVGAKLWLYRLKYSGGDWAANPKALPSLLREVKLAGNIPVSNRQETLTMGDLAHHRGAYMPSMVFMTGTGKIESSDADRAALRDYLLGGGMLVADSSGGEFESRFVAFIGQVLPGKRLRPIEFDHEVFRVPDKMPRGCPIYRDHGSADARGIFADDGRLMVFFSPGDLGSAWAVVDLGQKRGAVEMAFHMGTNLVRYSLMHVRDLRKR